MFEAGNETSGSQRRRQKKESAPSAPSSTCQRVSLWHFIFVHLCWCMFHTPCFQGSTAWHSPTCHPRFGDRQHLSVKSINGVFLQLQFEANSSAVGSNSLLTTGGSSAVVQFFRMQRNNALFTASMLWRCFLKVLQFFVVNLKRHAHLNRLSQREHFPNFVFDKNACVINDTAGWTDNF